LIIKADLNKHNFIFGLISLIFLVVFLYGIFTQAIGTLITRIIGYYGISMAQAGLLSSFLSAGNFVAIFTVTVFTGRINKVILLGASLLLFAISQCLISAALPFSILLVCFALVGVFGATIDTLTNSIIADIQPDNINRNMSLLHGFYSLGGLCGPVAIEHLADALSWTQVYFIMSLAFFVYLIIYMIFVRWQWSSLSIHMSSEKQARFGFFDMIKFFTQKRHILLWTALFFYSGNQRTLVVWIKRYVEIHLNITVWGAYALSAMWLGIAISRLLIAPNKRMSSALKICFGNLISAIALAAGLLSGSAQVIVAATLMVGLSSGLTIPLIVAMCCGWHQGKTALGTLMPYMAMYISNVLFPPFSGFVSDFLGISWGVSVGAVSSFLAAVFSGLLYLNLKDSRGN